jgi:phosphoribosylformimino-5-aminoimidazole carboxamide ribotide isomerase
MIAIPAIDLRGGACVQLVGGSFDDERIHIADPRTALRDWQDAGFQRIHVVDLDAATGRGDNRAAVDDLLATATCSLQIGGGIRTGDRVDALLAAGAEQIVVGTRAIEDEAWLDELTARYPNRIVVAADVRERDVVTRGWNTRLTLDVVELIHRLNTFAIGGLLVTAVHVEGTMAGPDFALIDAVVDVCASPVIASGGTATLDDLRQLQSAGVAATVIGMAVYTGALDARVVAEEFAR